MLDLISPRSVVLAVAPVDFRSGLFRLAAICRTDFNRDPLDGCVYVFRNKAGTALRMIRHDGCGWWMLTRRFSKGRLTFWPSASDLKLHPLAVHELTVVLFNGDPRHAHFAEPWRKVS